MMGPCCGGECCAPGSYCCQNAGPHEHDERELVAFHDGPSDRHDAIPRVWGDR